MNNLLTKATTVASVQLAVDNQLVAKQVALPGHLANTTPLATASGTLATDNGKGGKNVNVLSNLNQLKKENTNQNILNLSFFKDKKDSIQIKTNYNSSFLNILNKLINYTKLVDTNNQSGITVASVPLAVDQSKITPLLTNTTAIKQKAGVGSLHTYLKKNTSTTSGTLARVKSTIFHYNKFIDYNFNNNKPLPLSFKLNQNNLSQCPDKGVAFTNGTFSKDNLLSNVSGLASSLPSLPGQGGQGLGHMDTNKFISYTDNLLTYFFKSMYCLISKPVYLITPEKVTIQLFYFLNIPKKKIFKLYNLFYNRKFKKSWIKIRNRVLLKLRNSSSYYTAGVASLADGNDNSILNSTLVNVAKAKERKKLLKISKLIKIYNSNGALTKSKLRIKIRWKKRRTILRLRSKFNTVLNLLFKLRKYSIDKVYKFKFNLICNILSKKFNRPVELQLIRLHHPYHDSNILVNLLALNLKNKNKKSRVAISKIHSNKVIKKLNDPKLNSINLIPSFLSGLNINIAGRLMREPIIPRKTVKFYEKGATATGKVNYLDVATITKKNKKGAFTIKISSGQNLF
jgi:hypothetical protein